MCGIAGIICTDPSLRGEDIVKMTDALQHRGPDDWGYLALKRSDPASRKRRKDRPAEAAEIFFGHRRLSIIDIAGTQQPLCNEDASVWVSFNGEIYNYGELREELLAKGHELKEKGDTEVLVHLWEEYGEEMLDKLIGMFAFAIYDLKQDILFIARDRYGQKPVFYFQNDKFLAFASELQGLKQLAEFPIGETDNIAMAQYFRYGYIPAPRTAFKNVCSLPAGHFLTFSKGNLTVKQYWKPMVTGEKTEVDLDELQGLIDQSVKARLISDVPLGAFLSGGIDSALITASAMKQLPSPINTYTISTGDYWCDEEKEAQITADHLGTNHHTFKVKPDFIEISAKLAKHYGQPFADYSSIMTYYVSKETRKHATVALAGDGGDELFGGYNSYTNSAKYAIFGRIPKFLRSLTAMLAGPFLRNSQPNINDALLSASLLPAKGENISGLFHEYWREQIFTAEFKRSIREYEESEIAKFTGLYEKASSRNPIDRWMEVDQRMYLADDILAKVDIASMSVALECRAPFLDHRIAGYANRISSASKLKGNQTKYLLKQLALRQLQKEIVDLPKKGFSMPMDVWLRTDLKDWAHSMIFDDSSSWEQYLKKDAVKIMWQQHQSGKTDHSARSWEIVTLGFKSSK